MSLLDQINESYGTGERVGRSIARDFSRRWHEQHQNRFADSGKLTDLLRDAVDNTVVYGFKRIQRVGQLEVPEWYVYSERIAFALGAYEALKAYEMRKK